MLKLGLIGDHIARSQSPHLHRAAGELCGLDVQYHRLAPRELGCDFDTLFQECAEQGYHGLSITYPYKEVAAGKVHIDDAHVRALGAVNTVIFSAARARGYNTDYSGFIAAYRAEFAGMVPGPVCMLGAGGVGKAIAFGLAQLGVRDLRVIERDLNKAGRLAQRLQAQYTPLTVTVLPSPSGHTDDIDGIINCTPVGMDGHPGTPIKRALMAKARWAFDAVYTPINTEFLSNATTLGLQTLDGYQLFFRQGIDAFHLFTGHRVPPERLREKLLPLRETLFHTKV